MTFGGICLRRTSDWWRQRHPRRRSVRRAADAPAHFTWAVLARAAGVAFAIGCFCGDRRSSKLRGDRDSESRFASSATNVPLHFFIASRCPDSLPAFAALFAMFNNFRQPCHGGAVEVGPGVFMMIAGSVAHCRPRSSAPPRLSRWRTGSSAYTTLAHGARHHLHLHHDLRPEGIIARLRAILTRKWR